MNAELLIIMILAGLWFGFSGVGQQPMTEPRKPLMPLDDDHNRCPRCRGRRYDPYPQGELESQYQPAPELDHNGQPTGKLLCRDCGGYGTV